MSVMLKEGRGRKCWGNRLVASLSLPFKSYFYFLFGCHHLEFLQLADDGHCRRCHSRVANDQNVGAVMKIAWLSITVRPKIVLRRRILISEHFRIFTSGLSHHLVTTRLCRSNCLHGRPKLWPAPSKDLGDIADYLRGPRACVKMFEICTV